MVMDSCDLLCLDVPAAEEVRRGLDPDRGRALAAAAKVFADPTRVLIVQALAVRELCGCDLGWITGQSDKVVSHHLGRLRREGLVRTRREGKVVFASLSDHAREVLEVLERMVV
jgi:DNA-binding transcriptional ArsR family regulator